MYNSQIAVTNIKRLAKSKNITIAELSEKCNLSKNAIAQSASSTEGIKAKNLYNIADTLDCSVDYLLGRTDNPSINTAIEPPSESDKVLTEAVNKLKTLPFDSQVKILAEIIKLSEEK